MDLDKIKSQIDNLQTAVDRLGDILKTGDKDELTRDAAILRFEFTFELAWKLMQSANRYLGSECYSPKDCIRTAAKNGYIDNPERWFKHIDDRNLVVHTYNEKTAEEIFSRLDDFHKDVSLLLNSTKKKLEL